MEQLLYHFIIVHLDLVARKPDLVTREKQRYPHSHISIFVIRLLECLISFNFNIPANICCWRGKFESFLRQDRQSKYFAPFAWGIHKTNLPSLRLVIYYSTASAIIHHCRLGCAENMETLTLLNDLHPYAYICTNFCHWFST